uniref:Transposase n=1 Tax=Streptomyces sp. NBC_01393 TaxID=2903851 RepID=A0AAU3HPD6_9ACTN
MTPPRKGNKTSSPEVHEARRRARHRHSSKRITVEHALADRERWKQLTRWTRRRETLPATYRAIANLVSDRTTTG